MTNELIVKSLNAINSEEVVEICKLKEQHWPQGLKKQIGLWFMVSNMNDKLIYLEIKKRKIAFLRLKFRNIILKKDVRSCYIVTEVCVDKKFQKKGLGTQILKKSQEIIKKDKICGFLLSDNFHKNFYLSQGWLLIKDISLMESMGSEEKNLPKSKSCFSFNFQGYSKRISLVSKFF